MSMRISALGLLALGAALMSAGCATTGKIPLVREFDERMEGSPEPAGRRAPAWDPMLKAYYFDGHATCLKLSNSIPARIGKNDFSITFEFMPGTQPDATAYILEHHRDFPWTGLFIDIENNKTLRFRVKDLPHCDVIRDISGILGDETFHHVALTRQGRTLAMFLDGELLAREEKPEHVDLNIDYAGKVLTVGSHCEGPAALYAGYLRNMQFHIGRCMTAEDIALEAAKARKQRR